MADRGLMRDSIIAAIDLLPDHTPDGELTRLDFVTLDGELAYYNVFNQRRPQNFIEGSAVLFDVVGRETVSSFEGSRFISEEWNLTFLVRRTNHFEVFSQFVFDEIRERYDRLASTDFSFDQGDYDVQETGQDQGIDPGVRHIMRVITRYRDSEAAAAAGLGTSITAEDVPSAPRDVVATQVDGGGGLDVAWRAPASPGSHSITSYRIERSADGGVNWIVLVNMVDGLAYRDTTGLAPGIEYSYRVAARNSVGEGPWSDPSNAVSAGSARSFDDAFSRAYG